MRSAVGRGLAARRPVDEVVQRRLDDLVVRAGVDRLGAAEQAPTLGSRGPPRIERIMWASAWAVPATSQVRTLSLSGWRAFAVAEQRQVGLGLRR